jgi:hypothetical protein
MKAVGNPEVGDRRCLTPKCMGVQFEREEVYWLQGA